jgi:hypothetical protein
MSALSEKIIELAGAGLGNSNIAATVGCEPGYVTQVLSADGVQERVLAERAKVAAQHIEKDKMIEELEATALGKLKTLLPIQTDVMKVGRLFQVLNGARRRSEIGGGLNNEQPGTIVNIQLPAAAQVALTVKVTPDNQVIEVGGRSMVPMPSKQVAGKLADLRQKRAEAMVVELTERKPQMISNKTASIVDQL